MKYLKFRIILVTPVYNLTLPLTLLYVLPYLPSYLTLPYLTLPYILPYITIPYYTLP